MYLSGQRAHLGHIGRRHRRQLQAEIEQFAHAPALAALITRRSAVVNAILLRR